MIYDIYHDESKEEAYWHGFYLVPRKNKDLLLDLLQEARKNTRYDHQVHYQNIKKGTKDNSILAIIINSWTSIGISSLQQQKYHKYPPYLFLGRFPKKIKPVYRKLSKLLNCKFAVFKEKDKHQKMFCQEDRLRNIEITFKMALKGALHRLFNEDNKIKVGNIFIDGDEHYIGEFGRNLNMIEIINRLKLEKRNYVNFTEDSKIIPQKSDHRKIEKSQNQNDSHLLQLCDILIGGVRVHSYCPFVNKTKYRVSKKCRDLLEHDQDNFARMNNSRYCNGFLFNEAWIEDGEWNFKQINVAKNNSHTQGEIVFS